MAEELVKRLNLSPHPFGGYFVEFHRSAQNVNPLGDGREKRSAATSIYLVMQNDDFDPWHKMKSEETFYYHKGCSLKLYMISQNGKLEVKVVGDGLADPGTSFALVIPANTWFAGELVEQENSYGFFSVSVSPGFHFADSEMGISEPLCEQFPQHKEIIERFTMKPQNKEEGNENKNNED